MSKRPIAYVVCVAFICAAARAQTTPPVSSELARFIDPSPQASSIAFVRRALVSNRSIAAARSNIRRAQARLLEAELRPNPSFDFEHTTIGEEVESIAGVALPLELGGKRSARIAVARAQLEAARQEFKLKQRELVRDVLLAYAEALSAVRQFDTASKLNELDEETARLVRIRVSEGDAPPLELKLLEVEVQRLRAQRVLAQGRARAALLQLRLLTGAEGTEPVRVGTSFDAGMTTLPVSVDDAVNAALAVRPEVLLAKANEEAARSTLAGARAQALPDVSPFGAFGSNRQEGKRDSIVSFGVSVTLPIFNRGQAAKAEANAIVEQATLERAAAEQLVRADVESAVQRVQSSAEALNVFEEGVIQKSAENIQTVRAAYQLGEYRITELIAEQRRLVDSQREYSEVLTEHYRNLADLQIAMGASFGEE